MKQRAVRLALTMASAFGGVLLLPSTAHACSCVAAGPSYHARQAEAVFVGTVEDRDVRHPSWPLMSSGDPVTYRLSVERVYKGDVGTAVLVESVSSSASCGVELAVGREYVVYADRDRAGALHAYSCSGTRAAGHEALAVAERTLGTTGPPDEALAIPERQSALLWPALGAALATAAAAAVAVGVRLRR